MGLVFIPYRIVVFAPARKSYRIGLLFTHKNGDFCDGAKLRCADLLRGESHIGLVFIPLRLVFAPARKSYRIGLLFTHKRGDFAAISLTERCCATPIS